MARHGEIVPCRTRLGPGLWDRRLVHDPRVQVDRPRSVGRGAVAVALKACEHPFSRPSIRTSTSGNNRGSEKIILRRRIVSYNRENSAIGRLARIPPAGSRSQRRCAIVNWQITAEHPPDQNIADKQKRPAERPGANCRTTDGRSPIIRPPRPRPCRSPPRPRPRPQHPRPASVRGAGPWRARPRFPSPPRSR